MKTLGSRLALWYSLVSTLTLFGLLGAGYYLLSQHLVRGLDLLNAAEFQRIKISQNALTMEEASDGLSGASLLFYVEVRDQAGGVLARSPNLGNHSLSELGGSDVATRSLPDLGELRIGKFLLGPQQVIIATPLKQVHDVMEGYAQVAMVLVCLILLVSLVSGLILSQIALRPVRVIQETANRIRSDNLSERIVVPDVHDEVSDLARLLNEMFDRLEASFDQVRRFSAEASHELKTPLSLLRLQSEKLLTDGGLSRAQEEMVLEQLEEIARLNEIIEEMLFLSRAEARAITPKLQREKPRAFLQGFIPDARALTEHACVKFEEHVEGDDIVDFDPQWIRRVLLNLIANALNVSPKGGLLTLESDFTVDAWCFALEDEGPGLPPERREQVFERFVRFTPESTSGSGLGLAICRSIVEMHHGRIWAEEGLRKGGLRVVVEIPLRPPVKEMPAVDATHRMD